MYLNGLMDDLSKLLAKNLKARRGDLSQEVFSRKLGISRATLTRLESASQNTTLQTLTHITQSLKCSVGDLFK